MKGYRLSKEDDGRLLQVFDKWDNVMLMDIVRLIENLIVRRRKRLTMRERYCRRSECNVV